MHLKGRENYFEFVLPSVTSRCSDLLHCIIITWYRITILWSLPVSRFSPRLDLLITVLCKCISPRVINHFPGHCDKLSLAHWKSFNCDLHSTSPGAIHSQSRASSCTRDMLNIIIFFTNFLTIYGWLVQLQAVNTWMTLQLELHQCISWRLISSAIKTTKTDGV